MAKKKSKRHSFQGLSYRQTQQKNKENRARLSKSIQNELKNLGYKNVGWDNVIRLYQHLEELLRQQQIEDMSLEDLFLEADRIGNKYLTREEQEANHTALVREVSQIEEKIEKYFPDSESEVISFSTPRHSMNRRRIR